MSNTEINYKIKNLKYKQKYSYLINDLFNSDSNQSNILIDKVLKSNPENYLQHIISPITPYLLCDHHFSTEIYKNNNKYIDCDVTKLFTKTPNDLLKNENFDEIKEGDIIQVQVDLFNKFVNNILPKISCKIIIFTSQWHRPQIFKNKLTNKILNDEKIILWISQNPIYKKNNKYMAFPYGIDQRNLNKYMNFIKNNNDTILDINTKNNFCYNSHIRRHKHLSENHIRRHHIFDDVCKEISFNEYLDNILKSKFTISTSGDRDDCFRHYECIGLNSIPISNINFKEIFEKNMIYSNIDEIVKIINGDKELNYYKINRDILTIEYWKNKIKKKLN